MKNFRRKRLNIFWWRHSIHYNVHLRHRPGLIIIYLLPEGQFALYYHSVTTFNKANTEDEDKQREE